MPIKKALIISIISCAMISYLPFFRVFLALPEVLRANDVSRYVQRFEAARRMLPKHGVIGYRSDCSDITNYNCLEGFYLAQYAVSPIILDRSPKHALILGNYSDARTNQRESDDDDVNLLMDSGNGVKMYLLDGR